MTVDEMRYAIALVYKGLEWREKVDHMPDNQIVALYYDFCKRGKFDIPTKKSECPSKKNRNVQQRKQTWVGDTNDMYVMYNGMPYKVYEITNNSYIIFEEDQRTAVPKEACEII